MPISEKVCSTCQHCEPRPQLTSVSKEEKHRAVCKAPIPRYANFLTRVDSEFNRQINLATLDPDSKCFNEDHWQDDCPLYIARSSNRQDARL